MHCSKGHLTRPSRLQHSPRGVFPRPTSPAPRLYDRDLQALQSHLDRLLHSSNEDVVVGAAVVRTETEWLSEPPTPSELEELMERVDEVVDSFPRDRGVWMKVRRQARRVVRSAKAARHCRLP